MANTELKTYQFASVSQVSGVLKYWIGGRIRYIDGFSLEVFRRGRYVGSIRTKADSLPAMHGDTIVRINLGIAAFTIADELQTRDGFTLGCTGTVLVLAYDPTRIAIAYQQGIDSLQRVLDTIHSVLHREVAQSKHDDVTEAYLRHVVENEVGLRRPLQTHIGLREMTILSDYGVAILEASDIVVRRDSRLAAFYDDAERVNRELHKLAGEEQLERARLELLGMQQRRRYMERDPTGTDPIQSAQSSAQLDGDTATARQEPRKEERFQTQDDLVSQAVNSSSANVFVSHSHADQSFCRDLVAALRSSGANVWYDEHDLETGELTEQIGKELKARHIFLAVLSQSSLKSKWVKKERHWAFNLYERDETRVILPVTIAPLQKTDFDDWLFLEEFRRIELPDMQPYPPSEAIRKVLKALKIRDDMSPIADDSPTETENVTDLIALGRVAYSRGRFADALVPLLIATLRDPLNVSGWVILAATHRVLEQYAYALTAYKTALSLDPTNISACMGQGYVLADLRRFEQAIEAYDRALKLAPDFPDAWYAKAVTLSALGQEQEAEEALKRARELEGLEYRQNALLPAPSDRSADNAIVDEE